MLIRPERATDVVAIRQVHQEAFGGDVEVRLVDLLRDRGKAIVSLVAEVETQVVGHIFFSPVTLGEAQNAPRAAGLAPVGVLPFHQRKGIGSALIREGLKQCEAAGYEVTVVLGDPTYYSRFGFTRASVFGLGNEYGVDDEFMVRASKPDVLAGVNGIVRYAPEFGEV